MTYDAFSRSLTRTEADLSYAFDLVGNVTQRQNNNAGLTENFYYDNVYRFDHSTPGGTQNLALTYDGTGNITSRSDVAEGGTWTYGTSRAHAVTQAGSGGVSYTYDANGNVATRNGSMISWTSFDHPSVINSGSESVQFSYNQDHLRWRAIYSGSAGLETTYFVGSLLEKVVTAGANDFRHFIFANGMQVAVYSRTSAGANTLRYLREDHEGSVAADAERRAIEALAAEFISAEERTSSYPISTAAPFKTRRLMVRCSRSRYLATSARLGHRQGAYHGRDGFPVEGVMKDADGAQMSAYLYADVHGRVYEFELDRHAVGSVIAPDWSTFTVR